MDKPRLFATVLLTGSLVWLLGCSDNNNNHAQSTATPTSTATRTPTATATRTPIETPAVPDNLKVPTGNKPFLVGHAKGTQNYICLPSGEGFAWTFFSPQATVFDDRQEQIITHFLSPNPDESDKPRPTWQDSDDTSAVWGNAIASSSDPNFVAAGAIPWLLLQVVGSQEGPTGGETLTPTSYIQRVNTMGGVAPAGGCAQSTDVGSKALVAYTADYFFFEED